MALTVTALLADPGDALYYDPDYRNVLETHMLLLRGKGNSPRASLSTLLYRPRPKSSEDNKDSCRISSRMLSADTA